jgi:hypothetical protein
MTLREQFMAAVEQERILLHWAATLDVKACAAGQEASRLARLLNEAEGHPDPPEIAK